MKKILSIIIIAGVMTIAFSIICRTFDSSFANNSIDWVSFLVGIFLIVEAIYKMRKFPSAFFPEQFFRSIRILIGCSFFAVHLIQYVWGINCKALAAPLTQSLIDWTAFSASIFLIIEGLLRMFLTKEHSTPDQFLRGARVTTGTCVFAIHLLQFMRF
ncbi:MAG: hypothetical protein ISS33_04970 [Candidatus Omnitrophica bacterium]|nr:hypothetical protein [Candidatus Omnitrophota bacterium]